MPELDADQTSLDMSLLAVVIGNTNTRFGIFDGRELVRSARVPNTSEDNLVDQLAHAEGEVPDREITAVVIASDNQPLSDRLVEALAPKLGRRLYRIGHDFETPIERAMAADTMPGQDRLLNALAAWTSMQQACVVVDAGTAITVDFVDGEGVFQGGAIAPGATMMLQALHEKTSALPQISFEKPAEEPFGKNTRQSMLQGVYWGMQGAVRMLIERYAEAYEAYPSVVVTGSDAQLLFENDDLIDRIIPDLTLRGVEIACRKVAEQGELDTE